MDTCRVFRTSSLVHMYLFEYLFTSVSGSSARAHFSKFSVST